MIIGPTKTNVINFVDTCAGPWIDEAGDLSDTSIGIALETLEKCASALKKQFNPNVKILINSLSLWSFINVIIRPNIITNGIIIDARFGIKNKDK